MAASGTRRSRGSTRSAGGWSTSRDAIRKPRRGAGRSRRRSDRSAARPLAGSRADRLPAGPSGGRAAQAQGRDRSAGGCPTRRRRRRAARISSPTRSRRRCRSCATWRRSAERVADPSPARARDRICSGRTQAPREGWIRPKSPGGYLALRCTCGHWRSGRSSTRCDVAGSRDASPRRRRRCRGRDLRGRLRHRRPRRAHPAPRARPPPGRRRVPGRHRPSVPGWTPRNPSTTAWPPCWAR